MSELEKPKIYVSAFVCTETIRDKQSDLLTAVNITNGFNSEFSVLTPRDEDDGLIVDKQVVVYNPIQCHAVIAMYCEKATAFDFTVRAKRPDGSEMGAPPTTRQEVGEGAAGMVLNVKLTLASEMQGTHWIEIYTDGELATKLPVKIVHQIPGTYQQSNL